MSETTPLKNNKENNGEFLTIGALAKLCGVTVRTLRYYEEMDLIGPVKRTSGKYRLYNQHSLKRVNAILALQDLNYSLEEVLATLGPFSRSKSFNRREQVQATRRSLELQQSQIDQKLKQINEFRTEVIRRMAMLEEVCEKCACQKPEEQCPDTCNYVQIHD